MFILRITFEFRLGVVSGEPLIMLWRIKTARKSNCLLRKNPMGHVGLEIRYMCSSVPMLFVDSIGAHCNAVFPNVAGALLYITRCYSTQS